jgi:hypothetical protein
MVLPSLSSTYTHRLVSPSGWISPTTRPPFASMAVIVSSIRSTVITTVGCARASRLWMSPPMPSPVGEIITLSSSHFSVVHPKTVS